MNVQEVREFKIALLDDIHGQGGDPVADPEPIKQKLEAFS